MAISRPRDINVTSQKLSGTPVLLGTITATTSTAKNNHSTAVPFNDPTDVASAPTGLQCRFLMLQPDQDCFLAFGTTNAVAADSTGVFLAQHDYLIVLAAEGYGWVSALGSTATVNLRVFELL